MPAPQQPSKQVDILSQVPLFAGLPSREITHLADTLQTVEFPAGTIIFQEGGRDEHFYILIAGEAEVIKALGGEGERHLGRIGPGTLIGEMSLFSIDSRHTASVRGLTPLSMLEITRADFDALLHRQPTLAYELVRLLSRRLDHSENLTILDLQEKNRQLTRAYQELQAAQEQIIEKEKLDHELEIARQIQLSILPHRLPLLPGLELGALMIPAHAVGGDFYDFITLDDCHLGIVVGDVSDKGVPAALFMAMIYSLVRAEASRFASPSQTLLAANRHLLDMDVSAMFATALYGILDCTTCEFTYARAGHPFPLVLDHTAHPVQSGSGLGQPLGLIDDPVLDVRTVTIPPGGSMLVFSDGLAEANDPQGNEFGIDHLIAVLPSLLEKPAQEVCQAVWQAVVVFSAQQPHQDDFTLLCIKNLGAL